MSEFGQFCPIALASEVLTQKWMLLIIRELNAGSTRFNDIRRGVPRISATLLKQRLDQLAAAGVLTRSPARKGRGDQYILTEAGIELKNVLAAIGEWGQRWARDISPEDLDPGWLVWGMHRRIALDKLPEVQTVVEIEFTDAPQNNRHFWLVCRRSGVDVCLKHPGYDSDLTVKTRVITLAEVWRGIRPIRPEIMHKRITLIGTEKLRRQFPDWLLLSPFAGIARQ